MKKTLLALTILVSSLQAHAGENNYITFGVGAFSVLDNDFSSTEFRLEYRHKNVWRELYPSIGAMVNSDGGVYGVFSLNYDVNLTSNIILTPFTGIGLYEENDSKDLGGPIEFRSGVELAYQFADDYRLGVNFSHMSNASIYDKNPGAESLVLNLSLPY